MGLTFGQHLDELLTALGAHTAFGVPGGQTLPLYGAARTSDRSQVVMRDERNAACAADAFARVSGSIGICDATVGPGVTNLVSGLAEAHASSIPVLAVIADIPTDLEHMRSRAVASQAAPQTALLEPVSKWVGRVHTPEALPAVLDQAVRIAVTGRPGPVILEIPEDVFLGDASLEDQRSLAADDARYPRFRPGPEPGAVGSVADAIRAAERPLLLAGGGVSLSGAAPSVSALADRHSIPIATTINGKGSIDERHPAAAGVIGMFGSGPGNAAVEAADLIVAIGTKLDQLSTHRWRLPRPDQGLVHIDVDGEELGRAMPCRLTALADAQAFAEALTAELGNTALDPWLEALAPTTSPGTPADDTRVAPEAVVGAVDAALRPGDLLVSDASLASGWAAAHYRVKTPGIGMIAPRGLAGIGWSPGAAVGARMAADPRSRVIALAGDGAFAYGLGEIETAVRLGLDLVYVVLNNSALAWIAHVEDQMQIARSSDFSDVDYATVARGMGAGSATVESSGNLDEALRTALDAGGTHLLDVRSSAGPSPIIGYGKLRRGAYQ